jgi:hypothetical protein
MINASRLGFCSPGLSRLFYENKSVRIKKEKKQFLTWRRAPPLITSQPLTHPLTAEKREELSSKRRRRNKTMKAKIRYAVLNVHFPYMKAFFCLLLSLQLSIQYTLPTKRSVTTRTHTQKKGEMRALLSQSEKLT